MSTDPREVKRIRQLLSRLLSILLLFFVLDGPCQAKVAQQWRDGDLIFQQGDSEQALAVQRGILSAYSHMGIVRKRLDGWYVYEAIQPVQYTPLDQWVARGIGGHYVLKRLHPPYLLSVETIETLFSYGEKSQGLDYDIYFAWDDSEWYCSELAWKMYHRCLNIAIGKLSKLEDFDLNSPLITPILSQRYGNNIPWKEPVISPQAMFASSKLILIEQVGEPLSLEELLDR